MRVHKHNVTANVICVYFIFTAKCQHVAAGQSPTYCGLASDVPWESHAGSVPVVALHGDEGRNGVPYCPLLKSCPWTRLTVVPYRLSLLYCSNLRNSGHFVINIVGDEGRDVPHLPEQNYGQLLPGKVFNSWIMPRGRQNSGIIARVFINTFLIHLPRAILYNITPSSHPPTHTLVRLAFFQGHRCFNARLSYYYSRLWKTDVRHSVFTDDWVT